LISWILSKVVRKAVKKAIENIRSASELLKDFIVIIRGKAIFLVGFIVALSMLEVNIGRYWPPLVPPALTWGLHFKAL
jgi:hypothetical protein